MSSFVETWEDPDNRCHHVKGRISKRDLSMNASEVIAGVKGSIIDAIVERIMTDLGPRIDRAINEAWRDDTVAEALNE
jgi:hypothetical protein